MTELADDDEVSLCTVFAGGQLYGFETARVREVLEQRTPAVVPLAPHFIAGIISHRGDVLTVVSFRALLGLTAAEGSVVVLNGSGNEEPYGLQIDGAGGVITVSRKEFSGNPATLDEGGRHLYDGVFRLEQGLLIQVNAERLQPSCLLASGWFASRK